MEVFEGLLLLFKLGLPFDEARLFRDKETHFST